VSDALRDLYQEVLLDHYRRPRNAGVLADATHEAQGNNPLCGDRIKLQLGLDGDRLARIAFESSGCAISTAAASLMSEAVKGKTKGEAESLFREFQRMLTAPTAAPDAEERLGKLAIFEGVREFPVRVKCATLPWHTLHAALANERAKVTTE
jgi:nitrogen fixation NifU-like protein